MFDVEMWQCDKGGIWCCTLVFMGVIEWEGWNSEMVFCTARKSATKPSQRINCESPGRVRRSSKRATAKESTSIAAAVVEQKLNANVNKRIESWMRALFQLLAVKLILNSIVSRCAVPRIDVPRVCAFYVFNKAFRKLNVRNVYRNDKMMPNIFMGSVFFFRREWWRRHSEWVWA